VRPSREHSRRGPGSNDPLPRGAQARTAARADSPARARRVRPARSCGAGGGFRGGARARVARQPNGATLALTLLVLVVISAFAFGSFFRPHAGRDSGDPRGSGPVHSPPANRRLHDSCDRDAQPDFRQPVASYQLFLPHRLDALQNVSPTSAPTAAKHLTEPKTPTRPENASIECDPDAGRRSLPPGATGRPSAHAVGPHARAERAIEREPRRRSAPGRHPRNERPDQELPEPRLALGHVV
jgi:hypothetical protein